MKKRVYILLCLLLFVAASVAQVRYEVNAYVLNVRSMATKSSSVVGKLEKGEQVYVYGVEGKWAKINYNGQYAYASTKYLTPVETRTVTREKETTWWDSFRTLNFFEDGGEGYEWLVLPILLCAIALFIFHVKRVEDENYVGTEYAINCTLLLVASCLEIFYVVMMGSDSTWFCDSDRVDSFAWVAINFVIFGFVVYSQIYSFIDTLADLFYNTGEFFDVRWGFYAYIGGVIGLIVCGIFFEEYVNWVLIAFCVLQIIQIILIVKNMLSDGIGSTFLALAIYTLGSIATVLILLHFLVLLVVVLLVLFVLLALCSGSGSNRCSNCRSFNHSNNYCHYRQKYIDNPSSTSCGKHE